MYKHATPFLLRMNTYYQMSVVHQLVVLFLYLNQLYNLLYFGVWIPQTSDPQMTPLKGCLVAHPHSPRHTCGCYSALAGVWMGYKLSQPQMCHSSFVCKFSPRLWRQQRSPHPPQLWWPRHTYSGV